MAAPIQSEPFTVGGKTAIVTGAGSGNSPNILSSNEDDLNTIKKGINFCFAKLLLSRGCNVVIADLALRPEAQELLDTYKSEPKSLFVKTDVIEWDDLYNMFNVAEQEFGGADIVRLLPHRHDTSLDIHR